jgi:glucokinase
VERLIEAGLAAIDEFGPVDAVGIGVPGLFNPIEGTIELFPNLPGPWRGHPVRDPVSEGLGVPAAIINDARAFTLAEGTVGAGRGCRTVIGVTLGTGIGGGIMIDGKVHLGAFGTAGEIAHQIVVLDGPLCGCGNRGCAEAVARAGVIAEMAGRSDVEQVFAGVRAGDARCIAAVETAARYIGVAIANAVTLLGPNRIVVGGGLTNAGELVLGPIRDAVRSHVKLVPAEGVDVVAAELGPRAGAIGAALAGADVAV